MAEDHGFQSAEGGHRLCVNNCGFFGSPTTQNMCSKCYHDHLSLNNKSPGDNNNNNNNNNNSSLFSPSLIPHPPPSSSRTSLSVISLSEKKVESEPESGSGSKSIESVVVTAAPTTNRCNECRKKVGLTGFRCRCGKTFCGSHRYAEKHGCTFDFKAMGREAIAKANPVVKGEKLEKI